MLREIMSASWRILKKHPINNEAPRCGQDAGQFSLVLGQGSAVQLDEFEKNTATAAMRSRRCRWWRALRSWQD